jgi:hypothetical protein
MKNTSIATKQAWRFGPDTTFPEKVTAYLVTVAVPADELQERIDKEGADEAALTLGRIILDAIRPLEGERGIGTI